MLGKYALNTPEMKLELARMICAFLPLVVSASRMRVLETHELYLPQANP
jgi:hypothetical protein